MNTNHKTYTYRRLIAAVAMLIGVAMVGGAQSQSAFDQITKDWRFSASNYCIYPDTQLAKQTPAPMGKVPFYISHYGRHGSRYLSQRKAYLQPYKTLQKADSLGKLTPVGKDVMRQMALIINESEGRWGDLSPLGAQQHRGIARRMMTNFPEVFEGKAHIDAKSTTVPRCILSMGAALQAMMAKNPRLQVKMEASARDMWYMNHQDRRLRGNMDTPVTQKAYDEYRKTRHHNPRLMSLLFNDSVYVKEHVDDVWLNYYLLKAALMQQNTSIGDKVDFLNLFTYEDKHQFWQMENAWWYYRYGPSLLNDGHQPYTQRYLLRKMIEEADSCIQLRKPGVQLRYGHETIVLPLTCLLELNGFGYETDNLEELEEHGWWACLVFPMASNLQFVFYRTDYADKDVLVKVLLNENEATLPLKSDTAPYYRWSDVKAYYLSKIERYEQQRKAR